MDTMYYRHKELHKAVTSQKSGENKKARALWSLRSGRAED